MLHPLWTAEDVIRVLGGTSAVGRLTQSNPSAVSSWKRSKRSRIPAKYYPTIQEALESRGFCASNELFSFRKTA